MVESSIDLAQPARPSLWKRVKRMWPYFSVSRSGWILAIAATIVASATEPFVPALLKPLLDRGFQKGSLDLWMVPVSLILLFGVRGLSGFVAQYALAKVTNEGLQTLRRAMFGKLLNARLSLFADQSSSAIANTVVYEVFNGSSMMINAIMKLARDLLTLAALIAYLLFLNWKLMLIVSLLFPAVALGRTFVYFRDKKKKQADETLKALAQRRREDAGNEAESKNKAKRKRQLQQAAKVPEKRR